LKKKNTAAALRQMRKLLFIFFFFLPLFVLAQSKIKKVLVEGEGSPMVMLNGGVADMSVFSVHSNLLSKSYKVIRMEQFNVQYATEGLTLPKNYSVRMESKSIKLTLDSLNITEPIILIGHSYGGLIALDFALNYPNRIRSLVLIEPPVFGIAEANKEYPEGMKQMQELVGELTPQSEITEDMAERFRCALLNCDTIDIRQHPLWTTWVKQRNRLRGLSATLHYKISLNSLRTFRKPVLIITGSETVLFHKRINELLAASFPFAQTSSIQGGHTIINTKPNEFIKLLLEFLK
jgi:pimeloyl-ACP methyl ester carboxylesterase